MIDLLSIFSKGGIVLWCFQGTTEIITPSVNALIKSVFLQEKGNASTFNHKGLTFKFKLDNEFELVFLVAYQSIVQLSYADKLLNDVQLEFRDKYRNLLLDPAALYPLCGGGYARFKDFKRVYLDLVEKAQSADRTAPQAKMRTFDESLKSQKTIASMIEKPGEKGPEPKQAKKSNIPVKGGASKISEKEKTSATNTPKDSPSAQRIVTNGVHAPELDNNVDDGEEDQILKNREAFLLKMSGAAKPKKAIPKASPKVAENGKKKKEKQARQWPGQGPVDPVVLDYSGTGNGLDGTNGGPDPADGRGTEDEYYQQQKQFVGTMRGNLDGLDYESSSEEEEDDDYDSEEEANNNNVKVKSGGLGMFAAFRSLVGSKKLTAADVAPALEKMKDLLIAKNVATDISDKLCQSVATQLEGKVIGTFSGVTSTVKTALRESLVHLLSPRRRIDILRDVMEARREKRPFSVVFCGVNGVGKSTNLAKITFWLNENGFRVLIAACDTFRAGAVEQLRTHVRHLNHLHPAQPPVVQLYEQGYGKDPAAIAAHALTAARDTGFDVVLVDTAGRMQDNEPLMRALAKLIRVNEPDLVLFVGEALVGNEAVDQLTKFNQALADHSAPGQVARLIDGIVLTKFDTIDDKVGAAISMTYITGQPIVFVGTGQTYNDLKSLNANAVVHALMK